MAFHEQSFASRFSAMGDQAEGVFDTIYPKNHPLGLNRPPFNMTSLTLAMRYTPDRMTRDRMVEIQGIGRNQKLKIKDEKAAALLDWQKIGPVHIFVYDSAHHRYWEAPLDSWLKTALVHGEKGAYKNDGKTYMELSVQHFPTTPNKAPDPNG